MDPSFETTMFVWYVPSKRSSALQYLIYFNLYHICYRWSPVIEEYVRSPEIFRMDDDWFNSPELRGIPRHLIVFPSLDNQRLGQDGLCNWEPQIWSMLFALFFLKSEFLTRLNHMQVVRSWFFSSCKQENEQFLYHCLQLQSVLCLENSPNPQSAGGSTQK